MIFLVIIKTMSVEIKFRRSIEEYNNTKVLIAFLENRYKYFADEHTKMFNELLDLRGEKRGGKADELSIKIKAIKGFANKAWIDLKNGNKLVKAAFVSMYNARKKNSIATEVFRETPLLLCISSVVAEYV